MDQILSALKHPSKPVRLVKGSKLVQLWKDGGVLARRQELPEDFFLSAEEIEELYLNSGSHCIDGERHRGNKDGVLPIVVISFCWLAASHCDPDALHLATVAQALEYEMERFTNTFGGTPGVSKEVHGFQEVGVFWDWASLSQKDPNLWRPCCLKDRELRTEEENALVTQYDESRGEEETEGFRYALHQTMDLWYSHQNTFAYKLTRLPKGCERGRTIEVQGVSAEATEADVRELFSSAGKVQTVTMATGRAFVVFETEDEDPYPGEEGLESLRQEVAKLTEEKRYPSANHQTSLAERFPRHVANLVNLGNVLKDKTPEEQWEFLLDRRAFLAEAHQNLNPFEKKLVGPKRDTTPRCVRLAVQLGGRSLRGQPIQVFGKSYDDSGWTTFEGASSEQIKRFDLSESRQRLVLDLGAAEGEWEAQRGWPIGPDDFDVMMETRSFTNGSDKEAVKALYRKTCTNQFGGIKEIEFRGMVELGVEEARRLGGCLNLCVNLESLGLRELGMSDESLQALLASLSVNALPKLQHLKLQYNKIEDAGMLALASAIAGGAFPALMPMRKGATRSRIELFENPAGEEAVLAVVNALKKRKQRR